MTIENENEPGAEPEATDTGDESIMDALERGIGEESVEAPDPADEPEGGAPEGTVNAEDEPKPEGEPDPAATPDPAKPEKSEADKAVDDEVAALGLKGKTETRFRELSKQVSDLAPMREALEKAGIKDVAELPQMIQKAQAADDLIGMVTETGATPEQYGMTLDYLAAVNKAAQGDQAAGDKAIELWLEEGKAIHAVLGREMPGVHDPLEAHADLRQQVEDGDITRKAAMELVQSRNLQQRTAAQQQAQAKQASEQKQAQAQQQAGIDALNAWEAGKKSDPAYAQIRPTLSAEVAKIRQKFPAHLWAEATEMAYQGIRARLAAQQPQQPRPNGSPVRPQGPRPTMVPEFKSIEEALDFGINEATG